MDPHQNRPFHDNLRKNPNNDFFAHIPAPFFRCAFEKEGPNVFFTSRTHFFPILSSEKSSGRAEFNNVAPGTRSFFPKLLRFRIFMVILSTFPIKNLRKSKKYVTMKIRNLNNLFRISKKTNESTIENRRKRRQIIENQ